MNADSALTLLIARCSVLPDVGTNAGLADLTSVQDQTLFLAQVDRHRVAPFVRANLRRLAPAGISDTTLAELTAQHRTNALHVLAVQAELLRALDVLQAAGVACTTRKGVALAHLYYGDPLLRDAGDIDLLVPEQRVLVALAALRAVGYQGGEELLALSPKELRWQLFAGHHCELLGPGRDIVIELHWRPMANPHLFRWPDPAGAAPTVEVPVCGRPIPCMGDEDTLLYLCAHGARHSWFRLKWLVDLPYVLQSKAWDWPALFAKARRMGCADALRLGLVLSQRLLGWAPPAEVTAWLAAGRNMEWACREVEFALAEPAEWAEPGQVPTPMRVRWRQRVYKWRLYRSWRARLRELARLGTSMEDWQLLPLPDRLFFLYFPLRPFLVLWRRFRRG